MTSSILNMIHSRLDAAKVARPIDFDLEHYEQRQAARVRTFLFGLVITDDGQEQKCIIQNISATGAGISLAGIDQLPKEVNLVIDGYSAPTRVRVVWSDGSDGGVEFIKSTQAN